MENKRYKRNFLSNVVFKLDFPTLSDYGPEKTGEFQKLVKRDFQILEEQKVIKVEHKFKETKEIEAKTTEIPKWVFFNKTKTRIISFEFDNIIVEFKEYTHFEDFLKIINLVTKSLFELFPSIVSTRLGVRYINRINLEEKDPFEWNNLLNKSLSDSMNFISNKEDLSRHITLIELTKEDYRLRFQYGIANSLYPSSIIRKEFVLDYDCFTFESLEKQEEILDTVKEFNEVISNMFEKSIEDGLRKVMGMAEDE
jgi:uncharacterized protein (TIGR04255 family)